MEKLNAKPQKKKKIVQKPENEGDVRFGENGEEYAYEDFDDEEKKEESSKIK